MRKVVLGLAVSLDGYIEGPNGEYDWCIPPPELDFHKFLDRFDTIFVGRKTYEMSSQMEGGPPGFPKFKEYVFSTTLDNVKDGATLIKGNTITEVERIKNEEGKDIWLFGGAGLATSLMNLGMVDEFSIAVSPVLLGRGKPLFSNLKHRINLILFKTESYSNGVVSLTYSVAK